MLLIGVTKLKVANIELNLVLRGFFAKLSGNCTETYKSSGIKI